MAKYVGDFESDEDVFDNFKCTLEQSEGVEIIYACYDTGDWSGTATVIFQKNGKLYEVNGSHCSCYGLEDQWEPEETTVKALLFRPNIPEEAKEILRAM